MNFEAIYREAVEAGRAAAKALQPVPMVVSGYGQKYFVADGVCGFAWVQIFPGNSKLANWLKKNDLARKAYGGGVSIWIGDYNQSMQKKEAHADAMAKVFREYGFKAYAYSRLD